MRALSAAPLGRSWAAPSPKPRACEPAIDRALEPVVVGLAGRRVDSAAKLVRRLRPLVTDVVPADLPESAERPVAHTAMMRSGQQFGYGGAGPPTLPIPERNLRGGPSRQLPFKLAPPVHARIVEPEPYGYLPERLLDVVDSYVAPEAIRIVLVLLL